MYIVSFDPGLATGVATVNTDRMDALLTFEMDWSEVCDYLVHLSLYDLPDVFVYERFTITEGTAKLSPQTAPMDVIGAIKYVAYHDGISLVPQMPYDAKHFATDERLKAYGWYTKGKGHAVDATRHLYLYCVKHGYIQFDQDGNAICPS